MAEAAQQIADNPLFGEIPSGTHPVAYERHRAMMMAVKGLAKSADPVLSEIAHVGGDDVSHEHEVWEHIKDGLHDQLREAAADMRSDMRSDKDAIYEWPDRPHLDIRHHAKRFADQAREVGQDPDIAWIKRARGDAEDMHPDDVDALGDHAEGITDALNELFGHMSNSFHADWRKIGPDHLVGHPSGQKRGGLDLIDHPVDLHDNVGLGPQLKDKASELRG